MTLLKKCPNDGAYTMKENCPECGAETVDAHYKFIQIKDAPKEFRR